MIKINDETERSCWTNQQFIILKLIYLYFTLSQNEMNRLKNIFLIFFYIDKTDCGNMKYKKLSNIKNNEKEQNGFITRKFSYCYPSDA